MTASFKERRDQRSAEQIMLKNIAEKIDLLEQKRATENTDWRDDIQLGSYTHLTLPTICSVSSSADPVSLKKKYYIHNTI